MTQPTSGQLVPAFSAYQVIHQVFPQGETGGYSQVASAQLDATAAVAWLQQQEADALALGLVPFVQAGPVVSPPQAGQAPANAAPAAPAAPLTAADVPVAGDQLPPGV